jgi:hypothetical protein
MKKLLMIALLASAPFYATAGVPDPALEAACEKLTVKYPQANSNIIAIRYSDDPATGRNARQVRRECSPSQEGDASSDADADDGGKGGKGGK